MALAMPGSGTSSTPPPSGDANNTHRDGDWDFTSSSGAHRYIGIIMVIVLAVVGLLFWICIARWPRAQIRRLLGYGGCLSEGGGSNAEGRGGGGGKDGGVGAKRASFGGEKYYFAENLVVLGPGQAGTAASAALGRGDAERGERRSREWRASKRESAAMRVTTSTTTDYPSESRQLRAHDVRLTAPDDADGDDKPASAESTSSHRIQFPGGPTAAAVPPSPPPSPPLTPPPCVLSNLPTKNGRISRISWVRRLNSPRPADKLQREFVKNPPPLDTR